MPTSFRPNQQGFRDLANGPEIRRVVVTIAEKGKAFAESIAPVDEGTYAASFEVSEEAVRVGRFTRVSARLSNTAGHAAAVEFGNDANGGRGQHILGRTLQQLKRL